VDGVGGADFSRSGPVKIPTIRVADLAFIRAWGNGLELGLRRR
jgi:hypothetical protein